MFIQSGGSASRTAIDSKSVLRVSSGGTATRAFIYSNSYLHVSKGAVAEILFVYSGGTLIVSSGGTASIEFNPWQGAVSSRNGAVVTYNERDAKVYFGGKQNEYNMISKADILNGLTISSGLSAIVYSGGIVNDASVNSGGRIIGKTLDTGGVQFKLNLSWSSLEVKIDSGIPTVSGITASTTTLTNQDITVTAKFTANLRIKSSLYRIGANGSWMTYTDGVTVSENATVYFKAIDAAGNESKVASYSVDNIDKTLPTVYDVAANITETTDGIVLVSAIFSSSSVVREYSRDGKTWLEY